MFNQIVIDTNVIVSALRSSSGCSHSLFKLIGSGKFEINISVPLVLEYEKTLLNSVDDMVFSINEIEKILDYICVSANHHEIHFLWRPMLHDPKDEMVLEIAVASQSGFIVTFNKKDFAGIDRFGIQIVTPKEFLKLIEEF